MKDYFTFYFYYKDAVVFNGKCILKVLLSLKYQVFVRWIIVSFYFCWTILFDLPRMICSNILMISMWQFNLIVILVINCRVYIFLFNFRKSCCLFIKRVKVATSMLGKWVKRRPDAHTIWRNIIHITIYARISMSSRKSKNIKKKINYRENQRQKLR